MWLLVGLCLLLVGGVVAFVALAPKKLIAQAVPAQTVPGFLIAGARVFDGEQDLGTQDVLVVGERIQSVGAPGVPFVSTQQFLDAPVRLTVEGPTSLERADLLLVEGDPLKDVTSLDRISEVFQGGRRLRRGP